MSTEPEPMDEDRLAQMAMSTPVADGVERRLRTQLSNVMWALIRWGAHMDWCTETADGLCTCGFAKALLFQDIDLPIDVVAAPGSPEEPHDA